MRSEKCKSCGLVNPLGRDFCVRCGSDLNGNSRSLKRPRSPRAAARKFAISPWVLLLAAGAVGYYLYSGVMRSYEDVTAAEANRMAAERHNAPPALSRTQNDQLRAGQSGKAVANSPGLTNSQQHTNEINKLMK